MPRLSIAVATAWAAAVVTATVATALFPQRGGLWAIVEIGTPFLLASLLVAAPLAFVPWNVSSATRRLRLALRLLLVVALAFAVVRLGPVWVSLPPAQSAASLPAGSVVGVTSWNLESGEADLAAVIEQLRDAPRGVVSLIELAKRDSGAIRTDAAIRAQFPYQLLYPRDDSLGVGLLSSYPIVGEGQIEAAPPLVWAQLDLGNGRHLAAIAAHPATADFSTVGPIPVPFDFNATERDAEVVTIRHTVDRLLATGDPLVLAGDFNLTDREPIYATLSSGLRDAHLEVGLGPGSTWRPDQIKWLPIGLIRIDMLFGGNGLRPVAEAADCTPRGSDHCLVRASMTLP